MGDGARGHGWAGSGRVGVGRRVRRRLGFEPNPLRRGVDRIQAWARLLAGVLVLLGGIAGVFVGEHAYQRELVAERADALSGYSVVGRVVSTVQPKITAAGVASRAGTVTVDWVDRDSVRHRQTFVAGPLWSGRTVRVWVDAHGEARVAPRTRADTVTAGVVAGGFTLTATGLGGLMGYGGLLVVLNRRRMAYWDDEWSRVGPRWRRRTG